MHFTLQYIVVHTPGRLIQGTSIHICLTAWPSFRTLSSVVYPTTSGRRFLKTIQAHIVELQNVSKNTPVKPVLAHLLQLMVNF